jgi:hypothetical protein
MSSIFHLSGNVHKFQNYSAEISEFSPLTDEFNQSPTNRSKPDCTNTKLTTNETQKHRQRTEGKATQRCGGNRRSTLTPGDETLTKAKQHTQRLDPNTLVGK